MICIVPGCKEELWHGKRAETETRAIEHGWRFCNDGKAPALSTGACICPAHVAAGEEANWKPAKARSK